MDTLFALPGVLLLALATADVVQTTVSASGAGPVSRVLGRGVGAVLARHPAAGPVALLFTAAVWVGLFWAGWTLVFLADPAAVVSASGGRPATLGERAYFAGYTVVTLGLGDFVPSTVGWRVATVAAAAQGLVFITLGVTYYTAVLSAVVHKRRLASLVAALGESPAAIVAGAWDGDGFPGTGSLLTSLADHLALHDRQHEAYPVLHLYVERRPDRAAPVQVARLAEALALWDAAVAPGHRPPPGPLRAARGALASLLGTLGDGFVTAVAAPPPPDLAPLRAAGIPLSDPLSLSPDTESRRLLHGYVAERGHSWADVDPSSPRLSDS